MAFNKDQFKQNINSSKKTNSSKIKAFIKEFTDIVESEGFEDWLQKQLEYTNKQYNALIFYMGIDFNDPTFHFYIRGDKYFFDDNIVHIKFGHEYIALDKYEKEKIEYLDAMSECWKILKRKLKTLDILIITPEPDWNIEYDSYSRKIELELIEED